MKIMPVTVVIGALLVSSVHADLIDLTPGGFSLLNVPPVVIQWEQTIQQQGIFVIAHADISGNTATWVPFLPLGGSNFTVDPMVENANLTWNLTNPHGSSFLYLIVGNSNLNIERANLYQVSSDEIINGSGTVTIDGVTTITALNFFGRTPPVPDEANTGALLLLAVIAVLLTYQAQQRRNA